MQIYCRSGDMLYTWINARNVRQRLSYPHTCDDKDGPYVRIRWKK